MSARVRDEAGFSLIPAVATLGILLLLAAVALQQTVGAWRVSSHDYRAKRAQQAAEAAVDAAIYGLNRADLGGALEVDPLNPFSVTQQNCVVSIGTVGGDIDLSELPLTGPTDSQGRRWCSATTPEPGVDGSAWQYRISQLVRVGAGGCDADDTLSLDREVVAVGESHGVTRRVKVKLRAAIALLSGAAVQSVSGSGDLTMSGTARVLGAVQSNRSILGTAANVIVGNAIAGPGGSVSGPSVGGTSTHSCHPFELPAVALGDARSQNDNGSWTTGCHDAVTGLPISCKPLLTTTGGVKWDASERALEVWGNGRVVLTGSTYALCSLRIRDTGQLVVRASQPITRVFIDDPAECDDAAGAGQAIVDGQARIVNCHPQTQPQSLQLYALGGASATTQTIAGAGLLSGTLTAAVCGLNIPLAGVPMTVYAPRSHVQVGGSSAIAGQVAGGTVELSGGAAVQPVDALVNLNRLGANPVLPLYRKVEYVECTGLSFEQLPSGDPAQGC